MKKLRVAILVFVLIFSSISIYIYNDFDSRLKISSYLSILNKDSEFSKSLKSITIHLEKDDEIHFKKLYKDYKKEGLGVENQMFLTYYKNNNDWKKALFELEGKYYKIKVKSHGRTPYAQKFGKHFSLALKFKTKTSPLVSKRVNFIIYNRIQMDYEILKVFSEKLNLLCPEFELVKASFGSNEEYYYFIEERIDEHLFESRDLPMIIFNKGVDGALIYNNKSDSLFLLKNKLNEFLLSNNKIDEETKDRIKKDFSAFNMALKSNDKKTVLKYFDLEYMAKLNVFRLLYGSDGHGFNSVNLEMAYDINQRKFYPFVHRDIESRSLIGDEDVFNQIDNATYKIPFWLILDADDNFKKMTLIEIRNFLKDNPIDSIQKTLDKINDLYKSLFKFEFSYSSNNFNGDIIINNMKVLSKLIYK